MITLTQPAEESIRQILILLSEKPYFTWSPDRSATENMTSEQVWKSPTGSMLEPGIQMTEAGFL
jgi:hypothetical protein